MKPEALLCLEAKVFWKSRRDELESAATLGDLG